MTDTAAPVESPELGTPSELQTPAGEVSAVPVTSPVDPFLDAVAKAADAARRGSTPWNLEPIDPELIAERDRILDDVPSPGIPAHLIEKAIDEAARPTSFVDISPLLQRAADAGRNDVLAEVDEIFTAWDVKLHAGGELGLRDLRAIRASIAALKPKVA